MANDWSRQIGNLETLASSFKQIERKALTNVVKEIAPLLVAATPTKVSKKQGGTALADGALKESVRGRVHVGDGTPEDPSTATIDHGKLQYIAHFVEYGHDAPGERGLSKAGARTRRITHRPTPPHPFVRPVQDSTEGLATEAYAEVMTAEINKVLNA